MYVWAVDQGRVVEASLGYFITPLINLLLGVVVLRERLRRLQQAAVGLAALGVLYLTLRAGAPPFIALVLAISFSTYGLLRKTVAVEALRDAKLPYVVVLTNPTTGGVTASYAMLGDVHIAEPGALIGFAGPRVIEQTIREKLPEGFQRAEYLRDHGMVDMVVHRHKLRETIARICRLLGTEATVPNLPATVGSA